MSNAIAIAVLVLWATQAVYAANPSQASNVDAIPLAGSLDDPQTMSDLACQRDDDWHAGHRNTVTLADVEQHRMHLRDGAFDQLNASLSALESRAQREPDGETLAYSAYSALGLGHADYTPHFRGWVEHSPDRHEARLALGHHLLRLSMATVRRVRSGELDRAYLEDVSPLLEQARIELETSLAYRSTVTAAALLLETLRTARDRDALNARVAQFRLEFPASYIVSMGIAESVLPPFSENYERYVAFYSDLVEQYPNEPLLRTLRGFFWQRKARSEERRFHRTEHYDTAVACGGWAWLYRERADYHNARSFHSEEERNLREAVAVYPVSAISHYQLARVLVRLNNFSDSRHHFDIAQRLDPLLANTSKWPVFASHELTAFARRGIDNLRYASAEALLSQALTFFSENTEAHSLLARAHLEQGDVARGHAALLRVLAIDPLHINANLSLAEHYLRQDNLDAAEHLWEAVLAEQPDNAYAIAHMGDVHMARGDWRAGLDAFMRACEQGYRYACRHMKGVVERLYSDPDTLVDFMAFMQSRASDRQ